MIECSHPQPEVRVWLHGPSGSRDVTHRHAQVCSTPLTIAVEVGGDCAGPHRLEFRSAARGTALGEIDLECRESVGGLRLFTPCAFRNFCLPAAKLRLELLFLSYQRWRTRTTMGADESLPTSLAFGAMTVLFSCPRPVVLARVWHRDRFNMFPLNLLCDLEHGRLAFSLKSSRQACALTVSASRLEMSNVPLAWGSRVDAMSRNDGLLSIPEAALPFGSAMCRRQVEIESTHPLGSHTMLVGRVVHEERPDSSEACFLIHGIYQAWRKRNGLA
jgi:hypothetical protein